MAIPRMLSETTAFASMGLSGLSSSLVCPITFGLPSTRSPAWKETQIFRAGNSRAFSSGLCGYGRLSRDTRGHAISLRNKLAGDSLREAGVIATREAGPSSAFEPRGHSKSSLDDNFDLQVELTRYSQPTRIAVNPTQELRYRLMTGRSLGEGRVLRYKNAHGR